MVFLYGGSSTTTSKVNINFIYPRFLEKFTENDITNFFLLQLGYQAVDFLYFYTIRIEKIKQKC